MKKCFEQFSNKDTETIEIRHLPTVFRMLNVQHVANIGHVTRNMGLATNSDMLCFEEFVEIASKFINEEDEETTKYELKEAFRLAFSSRMLDLNCLFIIKNYVFLLIFFLSTSRMSI